MKPLPKTFRYDQFDFTLLKRQGDVALISKTKLGHIRESYEVVRIQRHPDHTWPNGKTTPAHEAMPGNEQWGRYGWTCLTLAEAERKFKEWTHESCAQPA